MNVDERVLHDVVRLLGRAGDHRRHPQRRPLVAPDQLAERRPIARSGAHDEHVVVERGQIGWWHRG